MAASVGGGTLQIVGVGPSRSHPTPLQTLPTCSAWIHLNTVEEEVDKKEGTLLSISLLRRVARLPSCLVASHLVARSWVQRPETRAGTDTANPVLGWSSLHNQFTRRVFSLQVPQHLRLVRSSRNMQRCCRVTNYEASGKRLRTVPPAARPHHDDDCHPLTIQNVLNELTNQL